MDMESVGAAFLASIPEEDPDRDGLRDTPSRFAKAYAYLTGGYSLSVEEVVRGAVFESGSEEMVLVKHIPVKSLCEHHVLPFIGYAHVAYYPNSDYGIIGLSKINRIVDIFMRRLQVQERLTQQISDALVQVLHPRGVAVILECRHMCMEMRGVETDSCSTTITKSTSGAFDDSATFMEFAVLAMGRPPHESVSAPCLSCRDMLATPSTEVESTVSTEADSRLLEPIPIQPVPPNNESLYRLYLSCAVGESTAVARVLQESLMGPLHETTSGISVLDIGAGKGAFLDECADGLVRYTAFEEDTSLYGDLSQKCQEVSLRGDAECYPLAQSFTMYTSREQAGGKSDVVLFSHSLYGNKSKASLIDHALDFVAPGGLLLVVHRWKPGGTLQALCRHFEDRSMLYNLKVWDIDLALGGLSENERQLLAKYCDAEVSMLTGSSYKHKIGCIVVEPHSGNYADHNTLAAAAAQAKGRVGYAVRQKEPALVIRPSTAAGIQACVRGAANKVVGCGGITCIGGGHSSNCLADNALVVDMGQWDRVVVDADKRVVRAGGGATIGEITRQCQLHQLAVPLGDRPSVGMGLILQGGLNHFMCLFGLATDCIQKIIYVNPMAEVKVATSADVLFRFTGAGTNFGIVLEVEMRAHPLKYIQAQAVIYRFPKANGDDELVTSYSDVACSLQDHECLDGFILWETRDTVSLATSYFAVDADGPASPKMLLNGAVEGKELTDLIEYSTVELFDRELYMTELFDPKTASAPGNNVPEKLRSTKRCLLIPRITKILGHLLSNAVQEAPTKWCYIHLLHGEGAVSNVKADATAFGCRGWSFAAVLTGRWPDGEEDLQTNVANWLDLTLESLLPYSVGVYGADLCPQHAKLAVRAFGPNYRKLALLKRKEDPLNLFRHTCPLLVPETSYTQTIGSGLVVIFCGRRCVGKDWLANIVQSQLSSLLCDNGSSLVRVVSISDAFKRDYANSKPDIDLNKLLTDREYKDSHRHAMAMYYQYKKDETIGYDAKCYEQTLEHNTAGILLLTGMRDGLDYARRLAGRPVILVKVVATDDTRKGRGWLYSGSVDDSAGECASDIPGASFWDLVYENNLDSNEDAASSWTQAFLVPAILKASIRDVEDTPCTGITYRDLAGGLLLQRFAVPLCTRLFVDWLRDSAADAVVVPEALGFVFASPVASTLRLPLVVLRKAGMLFGPVDQVDYMGSNLRKMARPGNSCGGGRLEVTSGALRPGQKVVIVDDCLASGDTLAAVIQLIQSAGAIPVKVACVMELPDLGGRERFPNIEFLSLVQFPGA